MKGQFPWIGRSRGSAGGMTTAKINDKNVMRAKAFEVTNPKTAAQVMQRNFFKQVQEVCASVTEDQLRSLFGVKPKTMTRRNALSKQIAAAYTITEGVKSVDFSQLLAIGNGEKVKTPIVKFEGGLSQDSIEITPELLNISPLLNATLILVIFNTEYQEIQIILTNIRSNDNYTTNDLVEDFYPGLTGYAYATCATDGSNVSDKAFGSFSIKTRATD